MTTITEDYVSFETAKLLKEKGFDEKCRTYYKVFPKDRIAAIYHSSENRGVSEDDPNEILCPTLQMAMKWLRETHDIDFDINTTGSRHVRRYHLAIWENKDEEMVTINPIGYFNKWEQACEAAIKYCLENLI